jgi:flagellar motor switch protein FliM
MVVLITLEIRMNDVPGMMNLCLPYVVMEPALNRLSQGAAYPRAASRTPFSARKALEASLAGCPVKMEVDVAHLSLSFRDLLDLRQGDVLTFTPVCESGALASLQGVARLAGRPGRSRGQFAFQALSKAVEGTRGEGSGA